MDRGELERVRTQAILARELPAPPAVVFDIGGGAGVHAFALAKLGYEVHLIDPVALHVEQARAYAESSGVPLGSVATGDARNLEVASGVADAVLLLGPLYHASENSGTIPIVRTNCRPSGRTRGFPTSEINLL